MSAIDPEKLVIASKKCTELFHRTMMSQATVSSGFEIQKAFPDLRRKVMLSHLSGESPLQQLFQQLFVDVQNTSASVNADSFPKMAEMLAKANSR